MLLMKHKKNHAPKVSGNRLLISVTVVGSAGPIRFVVNEEELVAAVIDTALKSYAREGRLPVLGSNFNDFVLCCPVIGTEALKPWETIGSFGVRNFMLCKRPQADGDNEKTGGCGNTKEELWQLEGMVQQINPSENIISLNVTTESDNFRTLLRSGCLL